jgi:DNA polymerase-3 subunit alpha
VGKKVVESLVEAGSFDFTGWSRDALVMSIDPMYESSSKEQKEQAMGFISLFAKMDNEMSNQFTKEPEVKHKTSRQDLLRKEKALLGFFLTGHPMDEYKDILQRLSCVPLRRLDQLNHDAVFRSAFIVESLQIRIASKSQKKFAILTISDGMERQELPIWPDLFEEKSHLLRENQLLYAVLQIEKKEDDIRLSCRWLDDLTKANEAMIETCDRAYDKAKHQVAKFAQHKSNPSKQTEKTKTEKNQSEKSASKMKSEEPPMKTVCIKIDADQAKLSHILKIKKIIQEHHGVMPVQIEFRNKTKSLAILHMDNKWGISLNDQFKQKMSEISSIIEIV